eukprot:TRINITY_DN20392_c0_g1_i1.p1 TRINITY_DN20392_c0_g1~~TRINITY_DN20392_c0_g1_i1.p1  ORF type:complete len:283 (+),score=40.36 TRINITY_DN20392_c0_g1_i1:150-998(+)
MAIRSVVKAAQDRRRSSIRLQEGQSLKNFPVEETPGLRGLFSCVEELAPAGERAFDLVEEVAGASCDNPDATIASSRDSSRKNNSGPGLKTTSSKRTKKRDLNYRALDDARTYKWAEARLSKSAALASANWDHPEVYMDYVRSLPKNGSSLERKGGAPHVARPSVPRNDIAVPTEFPPHLDHPDLSNGLQAKDIQKTQESTIDSRLRFVPSFPTEELVLAHDSQPLDRAVAMTATSATIPGKQSIDDSSPAPSKPIAAWADQPEAPMGDGEKPPAKCKCVLM